MNTTISCFGLRHLWPWRQLSHCGAISRSATETGRSVTVFVLWFRDTVSEFYVLQNSVFLKPGVEFHWCVHQLLQKRSAYSYIVVKQWISSYISRSMWQLNNTGLHLILFTSFVSKARLNQVACFQNRSLKFDLLKLKLIFNLAIIN